MGDEVKVEDKIKKLVNKNRWSNFFALLGLLLTLLLSCALICHGGCKYESKNPILNKEVITEYAPIDQVCVNQHPVSTTTCCKISCRAERVPATVTEKDYNNTVNILLCVSALIFVILALWGTFTFLLRVLKSEQEINSKVLSVELDIYKEQKMAAISHGKKENDNASEEKEKAKKYEEILKKMEVLKESVNFIKSKTSFDDKQILECLKQYIETITK